MSYYEWSAVDKSKLAEKYPELVNEDAQETFERSAKIGHDGTQPIVRIPKDVARVMDIRGGDTLKFDVELQPIDSDEEDQLRITYESRKME